MRLKTAAPPQPQKPISPFYFHMNSSAARSCPPPLSNGCDGISLSESSRLSTWLMRSRFVLRPLPLRFPTLPKSWTQTWGQVVRRRRRHSCGRHCHTQHTKNKWKMNVKVSLIWFVCSDANFEGSETVTHRSAWGGTLLNLVNCVSLGKMVI